VYFLRLITCPERGWYQLKLRGQAGGYAVFVNGRSVEASFHSAGRYYYRLPLDMGANQLIVRLDEYRLGGWMRFGHPDRLEQLYDQLLEDFGGVRAEPVRSFIRLEREQPPRKHVAKDAWRDASVVRAGEEPLDILLRRTDALVEDLRKMRDGPDLTDEVEKLEVIRKRAAAASGRDERLLVFVAAHRLRRRIALQNPLLNFDRLLFATHHYSEYSHMVDQYFGHNARPGGSIYRLEDIWSDDPKAIDLLADQPVRKGMLRGQTLAGGSFMSLELGYDATQMAFAWCSAAADEVEFSPEVSYQIFRANADGSNLVQLTDSRWNDFDPCFLPGGRIAFISGRRRGNARCGGRFSPSYVLHSMRRDGTDVIGLSFHETNEWHPSVTNDGMLIYTRWDYVDRDSDVAHHPWICYPDGRDPRSYHGNYPIERDKRPWMEMSMRSIPGSSRFIGVATPHHGQAYGSLIMLDQRIPDDNYMSQLSRITPEVTFPESSGGGWVYGTPWPLSENYYLALYDQDAEKHDIYLVDAFGNKIFIYGDPEVPALDPIPLRPRPRPPVIPTMTKQPVETRADGEPAPEDGTVAIMNVYDGDFQWPEGTRITRLRIVQIFPQSRHYGKPNTGHGAQSVARGVLGTVPVEADGSAYFRMPAKRPVYFQALGPDGTAIQSMKSDTYVHPGEQLTCLGCHEHKHRAAAVPSVKMPQAIQREPSKIQPELEGKGAFPVFFPKLVQPVLDKKCVSCHAKHAKAPSFDKKPVGHGRWYRSYEQLKDFVWCKHGGNGSLKTRNGTSYSVPGQVGARASKLYKMLKKGHHEVKLTKEELHRITLWLDCNSNYWGVYKKERRDNDRQMLPSLY
jgi:hypothetical protein